MPLNLSVNDGDITPYLKYNAKAGRFYVKPEGKSEEVEIDKPRLIFDMAHIRTGWIFYQEGSGPEKVWDPNNKQEAPRPPGPKKFKRGFEVMTYGADNIPGVGQLGMREFSSTAANVITAILGMYADYEAGMVANQGAVPFYKCLGVKPVMGAYGTNYEPQFALVSWVPLSKVPALKPAAEAPPSFGGDDWQAPNNGPVTVAPNARDRAMAGEELLDDEIPF